MDKSLTSLHSIKRHPGGVSDASGDTYWVPNTDVYVADTGLVIKVELSGMRKEDLELTIDGNRLKISGHRPDGCRAPKCRFLIMEISYGAFEVMIELPPGYELSRARAAYQNGFLRIDVPNQSVPSPSAISVPIESGED
ncbi:MAG: Hsp20/alpha crystallin family protein [Verrucomicrobia bacterium]|nr:Hsp20/alpha crystallin family protein [Verrucomicrobiota bacterium]